MCGALPMTPLFTAHRERSVEGRGGDDAAGGCEGVEDSCWEVERKREVVLYVEEM